MLIQSFEPFFSVDAQFANPNRLKHKSRMSPGLLYPFFFTIVISQFLCHKSVSAPV